MDVASHGLPRRPLPVLALLLAGTAWLGGSLEPGILGGLWMSALGILVGRSLRRHARGQPWWPGPWIPCALLLVGVTGLRSLPPAQQPWVRGEYQVRWRGLGRELGELSGHAVPVQLPTGFAGDGEALQIHESAQWVRFASPPGEWPEPFAWSADPSQIRRTRAAPASPWRVPLWIQSLRHGLAKRLEDLEDDSNRGLAQALLLGRSEAVEPELKDRFTRTGTRHLLALSGLHVGLMWWLWMRPICRGLARLFSTRFAGLGLPRSKQALLGAALQVLALLFLLPILGGGTPALRATFALGLADCARQVREAPGAPPGAGRRVDPLSLWALSLVLELLWRPAVVASVSLQLSYVATLGLIVFWTPCQAACFALGDRLFPGPVLDSDSLGKPRHAAWPWLRRTLASYLVGGVLASVIATLSTLPVIWIHFGEWSPTGVVGTLALLPLVALTLFLGWAYALFPWTVPKVWAAWPLAQIPKWLELFDGWNGTPHVLPARSVAWILGTFLCAGLALWAWRSRWGPWRRGCTGRIALACMALLLAPRTSPPHSMTIHVCDVGHGTAILVRLPCGRSWLFDAGSRDRKGVAHRAVLPLLRRYAIDELHVVISHGDRDHQGALARIASRVRVVSYTGPELLEDVESKGLNWDVGPGWLEDSSCPLGRCRVRILRGLDGHGNEGSRNLWIECDGRSVLLCGDAEEDGLANILPELDRYAPLAALLIPHHGSPQVNLGRLISHTSPEEVWFSASQRSPLAQNWPYPNIPTRWTARDGGWTVEFTARKPWTGNLLESASY